MATSRPTPRLGRLKGLRPFFEPARLLAVGLLLAACSPAGFTVPQAQTLQAAETLTPDTDGPSATISYSANPAPPGILVITALFDRPLSGAPAIQVIRAGVSDSSPQPMTGAGQEWHFDYTVEPAGGMQQLQEPLTVVVTGIVDQTSTAGPDLVDRSAYVYAPAEDALLNSLAGLQFEKHDQPPVEVGPPGAWDSGGISLGDVLKVGDTYWMYYTGHAEGESSQSIGLATSPDGFIWTKRTDPVLNPGAEGEWNSWQVGHPSVLWDNGQYHMWFVGQPLEGDMYSFRFGHTTSTDGIHWAPPRPVLAHGAPGQWDEERIGGLDVVKIGSDFYLYYSASSLTPEFKRQIGCATSRDGVAWFKCEQNPLLEPLPDRKTFEGNEVEAPNVTWLYGLWLMAYTGYGGPQGPHFQIGLARSSDGLAWQRVSDEPVLPWGPAGSFDDQDTTLPVVLAEGNRLWLWYTGLHETSSVIAVATAELK